MEMLSSFVGNEIGRILPRDSNESYVRAYLAKLRRGVGKKPGSLPDIWEFTLKNLPEEFISRTGDPTRVEWAAHMAITLFALHQQGKSLPDNPMSVFGKPLGSAVHVLKMKSGEAAEQAIKRRFDAVVTSDSPEELAHHLRGLIQLLRSKDIPLDYPRLAVDLYRFQSPEYRDGVRLQWGRDYCKIRKDEENDEQ